MYPASGRHTAMNASLRNWLSSDTGIRVDVIVAICHGVCVSYPAHFPGSSSHVWSRYIQSGMETDSVKLSPCLMTTNSPWTNEPLLGQLHCEPPSYPLQFCRLGTSGSHGNSLVGMETNND